MAVSGTIKTDLFRGASLEIDRIDSMRNRGVRVRVFEHDTDNVQNMAQAISAFAVSNFPGTTIPLSRMRAVPMGSYATKVYAIYEHTPFSLPTGIDRQKTAVFGIGTIGVPWGQDTVTHTGAAVAFSSGRPNGRLHGIGTYNSDTPATSADVADRPSLYTWIVPVVTIAIPFTLATNPIGSVIGKVGRVNSDAVTWGDYSFPAKTLRFNTTDVYPSLDTNGAAQYNGFHHFTARLDPWQEQAFAFRSGKWAVDTMDQYDAVAFAGGFPG